MFQHVYKCYINVKQNTLSKLLQTYQNSEDKTPKHLELRFILRMISNPIILHVHFYILISDRPIFFSSLLLNIQHPVLYIIAGLTTVYKKNISFCFKSHYLIAQFRQRLSLYLSLTPYHSCYIPLHN